MLQVQHFLSHSDFYRSLLFHPPKTAATPQGSSARTGEPSAGHDLSSLLFLHWFCNCPARVQCNREATLQALGWKSWF